MNYLVASTVARFRTQDIHGDEFNSVKCQNFIFRYELVTLFMNNIIAKYILISCRYTNLSIVLSRILTKCF